MDMTHGAASQRQSGALPRLGSALLRSLLCAARPAHAAVFLSSSRSRAFPPRIVRYALQLAATRHLDSGVPWQPSVAVFCLAIASKGPYILFCCVEIFPGPDLGGSSHPSERRTRRTRGGYDMALS